VRGQEERQRVALQARFGALQPKLTEAVTLMEANIEEPLSTDDIANLVGLSRRQLERLFKQYLGSLPSRYYLELRLQRARQLLLETPTLDRAGRADVRLFVRLALLHRLRRAVRQHPARRAPAQAELICPLKQARGCYAKFTLRPKVKMKMACRHLKRVLACRFL
jgi:AraC-like DNA-binding protein